MLLFNQEVFDEIITGAGPIWYTSAAFNDLLGSADILRVIAYVTNVSGSPTLTVGTEASSDGLHWPIAWTNFFSGTALSNNLVLQGPAIQQLTSLVRLTATLGGTNPRCRLKLTAIGRTL